MSRDKYAYIYDTFLWNKMLGAVNANIMETSYINIVISYQNTLPQIVNAAKCFIVLLNFGDGGVEKLLMNNHSTNYKALVK